MNIEYFFSIHFLLMKTKLLLFIIILSLVVKNSFSQQIKGIITFAHIIDGDTIPYIILPEVKIIAPLIFANEKERKEFNKLVFNIKKVYPYAKIASIKLNEYNKVISQAKNEKEKKRLMKKAEDELNFRFGDDIKKLNFTQGKILIKLIYRETGTSTFEIVRELRGKFVGFCWQTLARLFGYNLKEGYDREGKDKNIECIVLMIEKGNI